MKFRKQVLKNGDLLITADNEARAWLKEMLQEIGIDDLWPMLVDEFLTYWYPWLRYASDQDRRDLGALTSSPVLIEETPEGGDLSEPRAWWFPNYQIENELETLKNTGRLVMDSGNA